MTEFKLTDAEIEVLILALNAEREKLMLAPEAEDRATVDRIHMLSNLLGKLVLAKNLRFKRGQWQPSATPD